MKGAAETLSGIRCGIQATCAQRKGVGAERSGMISRAWLEDGAGDKTSVCKDSTGAKKKSGERRGGSYLS